MTVENANYISQLNPNWPLGQDFIYEGDDHIRVSKLATQQSFPNIDGPVTATPAELNQLSGIGSIWTTGDIKMAAYDQASNGWIRCDGAAIPVLPENQALITLVGANAPDLRGQFLRGWSEDATVDPDGPRAPLTTQAEELKAHSHIERTANQSGTLGGAIPSGTNTGAPYDTAVPTAETGGGETRPVNTAVAYFIKT